MKLLALLLLSTQLSTLAKETEEVPTWTNPLLAIKENTQFQYIGEYSTDDKNVFFQVSVLKTKDYLVTTYKGGLPGRGWDKSPAISKKICQTDLDALLKTAQKAHYVSPTMGAKAPENATLTMPTGFTKVNDGILPAGGTTAKEVGSFKMHLEFRLPFKPTRNPSNQDKGNSGIYIYNNYEIQVLDTFALDYSTEEYPIKLESLKTQWCGCLYKMKQADLNMALPPLTWQTYDIDFTAPVFEGDKKVVNGRLTVLHNGVKIHDDVELKTGTGAGAEKKQLAKGIINFQDHGNPTVFRNVWLVETKN